MERSLKLRIEKLPEGVYLATSDTLKGLVAQGKTISETIEIARDVAEQIVALRREQGLVTKFEELSDIFDYQLLIES